MGYLELKKLNELPLSDILKYIFSSKKTR